MAEIYSVPDPEAQAQQPKRRSPLLTWLSRLVIGAALIVLLYTQAKALILFGQHIPIALNDPYTLNYGEGPLLDQAVRLSRGENIYQADLSMPPYTITNYPPLYVLAQVPFVQYFGAAFWYGRLISLISIIVAAIFLCLMVQAVTKDWLAGIAAGLTLPTIPYIYYWSALARIDSLALALSMIGLCVITRAYRLLKENPNPSEHDIRYGIAGNLCRCTGYQNIVKAVQSAAKKLAAAQTAAA